MNRHDPDLPFDPLFLMGYILTLSLHVLLLLVMLFLDPV